MRVACARDLRAVLVLALLFVLGRSPGAEGQEQPLNSLQLRSSHNSYQRDNLLRDQVSLTDQLDRYNVWWVEFDVRWNTTEKDLWVFHDCAEPAGQSRLAWLLNEVAASERARSGITFLYFDSGEIGPCALFLIGPKPAGWQAKLAQLVEDTFGRSSIYNYDDFLADGEVWPSPQELLRRGKHFVPIVGSGADVAEHRTFAQSVVLLNSSNPASIDFWTPSAKQFTRVYPSLDCDFGNGNVELGLTKGYNFASTNCTRYASEILDVRLHPPLPIYVDPSSTASGYGTFLTPYGRGTGPTWHALGRAIERVQAHETLQGKSTITIRVGPADYDFPEPYTISGAMRIENSNPQAGPVTLR